jgi:hypothetical protein
VEADEVERRARESCAAGEDRGRSGSLRGCETHRARALCGHRSCARRIPPFRAVLRCMMAAMVDSDPSSNEWYWLGAIPHSNSQTLRCEVSPAHVRIAQRMPTVSQPAAAYFSLSKTQSLERTAGPVGRPVWQVSVSMFPRASARI